MPTSHPLSLDPRFPVGTVLDVHKGRHVAQPPGPAPVTTATVLADRTALITGLLYDTDYTAGATLSGKWTTVSFRTPPTPVTNDAIVAVVSEAPIQPERVEFGATGNGSTDDTAAFAAMFAAHPSGAEFLLRPGSNYVLDRSALSIPANSTIFGHNATLTLKPGVAAGAGIHYIFTCADGATGIQILGFPTFDMNRRNGNHGLSENITPLHLVSPQRLKVQARSYNCRGDGGYIAHGTLQPYDLDIDLIVEDVGIKESGDSGNTRQGLAIISGSKLRLKVRGKTVGSWLVDLEANATTDLFSDVDIEAHGEALVDGAVNIAPQTADKATDLRIAAFVPDATKFAVQARAKRAQILAIAPACTVKAVHLIGGTDYATVDGVVKCTGSGAASADVFLSAAQHVKVRAHLLGTTGAAGVKEETISGTADTTSGSPNLTNVASTGAGWSNGSPISGPGIPAGAFIGSGAGTSTMGLVDSAGAALNATATATGVAIASAADFNNLDPASVAHATRFTTNVAGSNPNTETSDLLKRNFSLSPASGAATFTMGGTSANLVGEAAQPLNMKFNQFLFYVGSVAGGFNEKGRIRTDGRMEVSLRYVSAAGKTTLADGDFSSPVQDGMFAIAHNSTDNVARLCVRANGTWRVVAVA